MTENKSFQANQYTMIPLKLVLLATALAAPIICPDNSDCYPELFVPSKFWQEVKSGQIIPAGLHVRLNVDTLKKEAKMLEKESDANDKSLQPVSDEITNEITKENDFKSCLRGVNSFTVNPTSSAQVLDCLELLADLSHDLEHGVELVKNVEPLLTLSGLSDQKMRSSAIPQDETHRIKETALRAVAASLRNNPDALEVFWSHADSNLMELLMQRLEHSEDQVILKRYLGVLSGLTENDTGFGKFKSCHGNQRLLAVLDRLDSSSQSRALRILQHTSLQKRDTEQDETLVLFRLLTETLTKEEISTESQFRNLFGKLVELKKSSFSGMKMDSDFLEWLNKQIDKRKINLSPRDDEEPVYEDLLKARHQVFGNPMAMRKAMADEL